MILVMKMEFDTAKNRMVFTTGGREIGFHRGKTYPSF